MGELSIEEKAKAYDEAIKRAKAMIKVAANQDESIGFANTIFPELKESEDERIRKTLIEYFNAYPKDYYGELKKSHILAWLEKQGKCKTDCHRNHQDANHPNGGIVLEDFNGGEGFYKVHLDYLNEKQVKEVEEMVRTWNKDSKVSNENIKSCVGMCLTDVCEQRFKDYNTSLKDCLAWLERQGDTNETINKDEKQRILRGIAINLIAWIDYNAAGGNMCLSIMECKDIENALVSGDWDKIYAYIKKKLEKQGEKEFTFKSIPRLLEMVEPTDRAKSYCQKLIDSLVKERYGTDAKIVEGVLKGWNGEYVPMTIMDEQNPADKSEPKFHNGDWVTDGYLHCKISDVLDDRYIVDTKFAKRSAITFKRENNYHLWTLEDAKDGDVLVNGSNIFIFHFIKATRLMGYCHVNTDDGRFYNDIGKNECFCLIDAVVTPATNAQRDILFQKMKEAGYEWDAEKKELKIIDWSKHVKYEPNGPSIIDENTEWSEEDERNLKGIVDEIEANKNTAPDYDLATYDRFLSWLKSIRQRIGE